MSLEEQDRRAREEIAKADEYCRKVAAGLTLKVEEFSDLKNRSDIELQALFARVHMEHGNLVSAGHGGIDHLRAQRRDWRTAVEEALESRRAEPPGKAGVPTAEDRAVGRLATGGSAD